LKGHFKPGKREGKGSKEEKGKEGKRCMGWELRCPPRNKFLVTALATAQ